MIRGNSREFPVFSDFCIISERYTRSKIKEAFHLAANICSYYFYARHREIHILLLGSEKRAMRLPVKYLRHPDTIALATPGSFHIHSSQFSFHDTISCECERNITSLHGESSLREYICTRVILARNSRVLSGFFSVSMVTHVGRTQAWRAYRDVCYKVTFSLFLSLSRRSSDPSCETLRRTFALQLL